MKQLWQANDETIFCSKKECEQYEDRLIKVREALNELCEQHNFKEDGLDSVSILVEGNVVHSVSIKNGRLWYRVWVDEFLRKEKFLMDREASSVSDILLSMKSLITYSTPRQYAIVFTTTPDEISKLDLSDFDGLVESLRFIYVVDTDDVQVTEVVNNVLMAANKNEH